MDFPYLAKVVKLNVAALAALARTPQPPEPQVEGAVSTDTTLTWKPVPGAAGYVVRWRPTDAADWTESLRVPAAEAHDVDDALDPHEQGPRRKHGHGEWARSMHGLRR